TTAWMSVGFALFEALANAGKTALEVYPHGAFKELTGGPLPSKRTIAGVAGRAAGLEHLRLGGRGVRALWPRASGPTHPPGAHALPDAATMVPRSGCRRSFAA